MKLHYLILLFFATVLSAQAQQITVDFESINLELDSFLNGSDGTTSFCLPEEGNDNCLFEFPVRFDTSFGGFWAGGWAISTVLDTTDGSFMNLYGASAGRGFDQSNTYAVGQQGSFFRPDVADLLSNGAAFRSFYVTNTTFAARAIRDGSPPFSDPFGGSSGDEPDFFKLIVRGFAEGQATGDTTEIFLADYRFDDNDQDFIIEDWTLVELDSWALDIDSISFTLESSDVDSVVGINTPTFFAIDQITFDLLASLDDPTPDWAPVAYPNPSPNGLIELDWPTMFSWTAADWWYLHDALGRPIARGNQRLDYLNLADQPRGVYYLILNRSEARYSIKLVR
ncbi:MAG: DUF4465 domain-containing protein [Bacteroidota bacterium]